MPIDNNDEKPINLNSFEDEKPIDIGSFENEKPIQIEPEFKTPKRKKSAFGKDYLKYTGHAFQNFKDVDSDFDVYQGRLSKEIDRIGTEQQEAIKLNASQMFKAGASKEQVQKYFESESKALGDEVSELYKKEMETITSKEGGIFHETASKRGKEAATIEAWKKFQEADLSEIIAPRYHKGIENAKEKIEKLNKLKSSFVKGGRQDMVDEIDAELEELESQARGDILNASNIGNQVKDGVEMGMKGLFGFMNEAFNTAAELNGWEARGDSFANIMMKQNELEQGRGAEIVDGKELGFLDSMDQTMDAFVENPLETGIQLGQSMFTDGYSLLSMMLLGGLANSGKAAKTISSFRIKKMAMADAYVKSKTAAAALGVASGTSKAANFATRGLSAKTMAGVSNVLAKTKGTAELGKIAFSGTEFGVKSAALVQTGRQMLFGTRLRATAMGLAGDAAGSGIDAIIDNEMLNIDKDWMNTALVEAGQEIMVGGPLKAFGGLYSGALEYKNKEQFKILGEISDMQKKLAYYRDISQKDPTFLDNPDVYWEIVKLMDGLGQRIQTVSGESMVAQTQQAALMQKRDPSDISHTVDKFDRPEDLFYYEDMTDISPEQAYLLNRRSTRARFGTVEDIVNNEELTANMTPEEAEAFLKDQERLSYADDLAPEEMDPKQLAREMYGKQDGTIKTEGRLDAIDRKIASMEIENIRLQRELDRGVSNDIKREELEKTIATNQNAIDRIYADPNAKSVDALIAQTKEIKTKTKRGYKTETITEVPQNMQGPIKPRVLVTPGQDMSFLPKEFQNRATAFFKEVDETGVQAYVNQNEIRVKFNQMLVTETFDKLRSNPDPKEMVAAANRVAETNGIDTSVDGKITTPALTEKDVNRVMTHIDSNFKGDGATARDKKTKFFANLMVDLTYANALLSNPDLKIDAKQDDGFYNQLAINFNQDPTFVTRKAFEIASGKNGVPMSKEDGFNYMTKHPNMIQHEYSYYQGTVAKVNHKEHATEIQRDIDAIGNGIENLNILYDDFLRAKPGFRDDIKRKIMEGHAILSQAELILQENVYNYEKQKALEESEHSAFEADVENPSGVDIAEMEDQGFAARSTENILSENNGSSVIQNEHGESISVTTVDNVVTEILHTREDGKMNLSEVDKTTGEVKDIIKDETIDEGFYDDLKTPVDPEDPSAGTQWNLSEINKKLASLPQDEVNFYKVFNVDPNSGNFEDLHQMSGAIREAWNKKDPRVNEMLQEFSIQLNVEHTMRGQTYENAKDRFMKKSFIAAREYDSAKTPAEKKQILEDNKGFIYVNSRNEVQEVSDTDLTDQNQDSEFSRSFRAFLSREIAEGRTAITATPGARALIPYYLGLRGYNGANSRKMASALYESGAFMKIPGLINAYGTSDVWLGGTDAVNPKTGKTFDYVQLRTTKKYDDVNKVKEGYDQHLIHKDEFAMLLDDPYYKPKSIRPDVGGTSLSPIITKSTKAADRRVMAKAGVPNNYQYYTQIVGKLNSGTGIDPAKKKIIDRRNLQEGDKVVILDHRNVPREMEMKLMNIAGSTYPVLFNNAIKGAPLTVVISGMDKLNVLNHPTNNKYVPELATHETETQKAEDKTSPLSVKERAEMEEKALQEIEELSLEVQNELNDIVSSVDELQGQAEKSAIDEMKKASSVDNKVALYRKYKEQGLFQDKNSEKLIRTAEEREKLVGQLEQLRYEQKVEEGKRKQIIPDRNAIGVTRNTIGAEGPFSTYGPTNLRRSNIKISPEENVRVSHNDINATLQKSVLEKTDMETLSNYRDGNDLSYDGLNIVGKIVDDITSRIQLSHGKGTNRWNSPVVLDLNPGSGSLYRGMKEDVYVDGVNPPDKNVKSKILDTLHSDQMNIIPNNLNNLSSKNYDVAIHIGDPYKPTHRLDDERFRSDLHDSHEESLMNLQHVKSVDSFYISRAFNSVQDNGFVVAVIPDEAMFGEGSNLWKGVSGKGHVLQANRISGIYEGGGDGVLVVMQKTKGKKHDNGRIGEVKFPASDYYIQHFGALVDHTIKPKKANPYTQHVMKAFIPDRAMRPKGDQYVQTPLTMDGRLEEAKLDNY
jgi:hypothetical protein